MNYLSPLEFRVTVSRMPNVEFFTQSVQIPGVSVNPPETNNPFNRLVFTPEKLQYSPLALSFILDEKMANYREILSWIKGISFPQDYSQFDAINKSEEGLRSDISVLIMNSSKNPNIVVNYIDCMPVSLSGVRIDTTMQEPIYPTAEVEFAYNYFTIELIE